MGIDVAFILAAGQGTRLAPLTLHTPKPLLEVCGTPLIHFALRMAVRAGVRAVYVNSHWLHPQIPHALRDRYRFEGREIEIRYTHEPVLLGTGGGLRGLLARADEVSRPERILVLNADALIDTDVEALAKFRPDAFATLVLTTHPQQGRYGVLGTDEDDWVVTFAGRIPALRPPVRERMFCGVHTFKRELLDVLPPVAVASGEATGEPSGVTETAYPHALLQGARVAAFDHQGTFCDVGTPERLLEANLKVLSGQWSSQWLAPFADFDVRGDRVFVHPTAQVAATARLVSPVVIAENAVVRPGAQVGPFAVIGPRAQVAADARVTASVLLSDTVVDGVCVDTIVHPACRVVVDAAVGQEVLSAARHRA